MEKKTKTKPRFLKHETLINKDISKLINRDSRSLLVREDGSESTLPDLSGNIVQKWA